MNLQWCQGQILSVSNQNFNLRFNMDSNIHLHNVFNLNNKLKIFSCQILSCWYVVIICLFPYWDYPTILDCQNDLISVRANSRLRDSITQTWYFHVCVILRNFSLRNWPLILLSQIKHFMSFFWSSQGPFLIILKSAHP